MGETFSRIRIYVDKNGILPKKLNQLPEREGYINRLTDGWDRELLYKLEGDKKFHLHSLGKDGKVGGSGDNRDLVRSYIQDSAGYFKQASGNF